MSSAGPMPAEWRAQDSNLAGGPHQGQRALRGSTVRTLHAREPQRSGLRGPGPYDSNGRAISRGSGRRSARTAGGARNVHARTARYRRAIPTSPLGGDAGSGRQFGFRHVAPHAPAAGPGVSVDQQPARYGGPLAQGRLSYVVPPTWGDQTPHLGGRHTHYGNGWCVASRRLRFHAESNNRLGGLGYPLRVCPEPNRENQTVGRFRYPLGVRPAAQGDTPWGVYF